MKILFEKKQPEEPANIYIYAQIQLMATQKEHLSLTDAKHV